MKKQNIPIFNLLLAFGVICIIVGLFLLLRVSFNYQLEFSFLSFAVTFTGAVLFYLSMTITRRALFFFLGLYLCLASFFTWFVTSGLIPLSMTELWPVEVVLSGICLAGTGIFKNHTLRTRYLFPSVTLIVFGLVFLLFSLDIIRVSFFSVFSRWWPLLLILLGLALVVLFACQHRSDIHFPYEADECYDGETSVSEDGDE
ncbi:MAG: DUF5668 domain-containing protein [Treponema sp.]|nr:DUF5668 domain-containing protein [Treponema sp.]